MDEVITGNLNSECKGLLFLRELYQEVEDISSKYPPYIFKFSEEYGLISQRILTDDGRKLLNDFSRTKLNVFQKSSKKFVWLDAKPTRFFIDEEDNSMYIVFDENDNSLYGKQHKQFLEDFEIIGNETKELEEKRFGSKITDEFFEAYLFGLYKHKFEMLVYKRACLQGLADMHVGQPMTMNIGNLVIGDVNNGQVGNDTTRTDIEQGQNGTVSNT
jgi:hypothetical protein